MWLSTQAIKAGKRDWRNGADAQSALGLLLNVVVHPADIQDRDGAFHLLRRARRLFPFIERIFADGGYAGRKMAMTVWRTGAWSLQIVKRSDAAGFEVLPKRWIVERTFAWISRNRRLARDFERYATTVAAFIRLAMIRIMLRRIAANASAMNPNFPDGLSRSRQPRRGLQLGYGSGKAAYAARWPELRTALGRVQLPFLILADCLLARLAEGAPNTSGDPLSVAKTPPPTAGVPIHIPGKQIQLGSLRVLIT